MNPISTFPKNASGVSKLIQKLFDMDSDERDQYYEDNHFPFNERFTMNGAVRARSVIQNRVINSV
jgi:hypothetical protein